MFNKTEAFSCNLLSSSCGFVPMDWNALPIGKVTTLCQYGLSIAVHPEGEIPILGMKDILNGVINLQDLLCTSVDESDIEKFCLKRGDILLNRTNSYDLVGKTGIFDSDELVVFASYLVRFQFDQKIIIPEFVNYCLNSYLGKQCLKRLATKGVSQANINPTIFREKFILPVPSLSEQKKIAEILGTWDEAIALTEKAIAAKQKLKKYLLSLLFSGKFRFSEFQDDNWKYIPLKECTVFIRDGTHGTHPRLDSGVPLLSALNISDQGEIIFGENISYISEEEYNKIHKKYDVCENDLLLTVVGTIGRRALVKRNQPKASFQRSVGIFRFSEKILPKFAYQYFGTSYFQKELWNRANITAQPGVYLQELEKIKIPLLNIREQEKIADIFDLLDLDVSYLNKLRDSQINQKQGLMQKLLTGKWRVTVESEA